MTLLLGAVVGGLLGALAMTLVATLLRAVRWPTFDFGELIATKLLRVATDHRTRLGTLLHFAVGIVLALLYAAFLAATSSQASGPILPVGEPWRSVLFGAALWLGMMVIVMPLLGEDAFGRRIGRSVGPVTLAQHVLYGLILGLALLLAAAAL